MAEHQVTLPTAVDIITLQVGERRFTTRKETLKGGSGFFSALLSGRWDNVQPDGSYFIDADGDLFKHILEYLRRGVPPIFYDRSKGHDHALYLRLLAEARYFQIDSLREWLEKKQYLEVLKIEHQTREVESSYLMDQQYGSDIDVEYYPSWGTKKVYVCPRGIEVHRGLPGSCGRACMNARDGEDVYDEEPVLRTLIVKKRTILDSKKCLEAQESTA